MKKVLIRIVNNMLNEICKKFCIGVESKNFFFSNLIKNNVVYCITVCKKKYIQKYIQRKSKDHRDSCGGLNKKSSNTFNIQAFLAAPSGLEPEVF